MKWRKDTGMMEEYAGRYRPETVKEMAASIRAILDDLERKELSAEASANATDSIFKNLLQLAWASGRNPFKVIEAMGNWYLDEFEEEEERVFECFIRPFDAVEDI
jgi:hypothetical protein